MNHHVEFDQVVDDMELVYQVSTLEETILNMLGITADSPPPTSTPPPTFPDWVEVNTHPQPAQSQDGEIEDHASFETYLDQLDPQGPWASSRSFLELLCEEDIMEPDQMCSRDDEHNQEQELPWDFPEDEAPTTSAAAAVTQPAAAAAPPQPLNVEPVTLSEGFLQNLQPVGVLNGQVLYEIPAADFPASVCAAPVVNTSKSRKRRREETQHSDRPYIKKPPNAFMLFMREQRPNVAAEILQRGNAVVNAFLGQRWNSLTQEEQAAYYELAEEERRQHSLLYPEWSSSDNYGKKRKRVRKSASTRTEAVMGPSRAHTEPCAVQTGGTAFTHVGPLHCACVPPMSPASSI